MSRNCELVHPCFPDNVIFIHGWNDVGPYILLRDLIKKKRAFAVTSSNNDKHPDLSVIEKFIISSNDDIFRNVLDYLISNEIHNSTF